MHVAVLLEDDEGLACGDDAKRGVALRVGPAVALIGVQAKDNGAILAARPQPGAALHAQFLFVVAACPELARLPVRGRGLVLVTATLERRPELVDLSLKRADALAVSGRRLGRLGFQPGDVAALALCV